MTDACRCPAGDLLEQFILGQLDPISSRQIQDHVQVCFDCQERLEETRDYIATMRSALRKLAAEATES